MGGQIIDASIIAVPIQRNRRDETSRSSAVRHPRAWTEEPAKRQYGYKNHVTIDRRHKLIRRYRVTDAAVHDSQWLRSC